MNNKVGTPLKFVFSRTSFKGASGIVFNEKENRIVASFKLQVKDGHSLVLKTVYREEGKIILAVFDKFLSRYGWKKLEFKNKPGHAVSIWKINRDLNTVFDRIRELAKYINST